MIYALVVTIAAGLLLLALLGGAVLLARRAAGATDGWPSFGRWRWYPSALGLALLLLAGGLLLWRLFPALLFIPIILPFFLRGRFRWRGGSSTVGGGNGDGSIDGHYRRLEDK